MKKSKYLVSLLGNDKEAIVTCKLELPCELQDDNLRTRIEMFYSGCGLEVVSIRRSEEIHNELPTLDDVIEAKLPRGDMILTAQGFLDLIGRISSTDDN